MMVEDILKRCSSGNVLSVSGDHPWYQRQSSHEAGWVLVLVVGTVLKFQLDAMGTPFKLCDVVLILLRLADY